jgi:hypothetical protein
MTIPCTQNKCTKPVMRNFILSTNNKTLLCSNKDVHKKGTFINGLDKSGNETNPSINTENKFDILQTKEDFS